MPLTLVRRSGRDSLGKLEAAAIGRMREAEALFVAGQRLGAVCLYGYVIEISLKTAYYRLIGLVPATLVDKHLHRFPAENSIKAMVGLPAHPPGPTIAGHNVIGWARLLHDHRSAPLPGRVPLDAKLATELHGRMQDAFNCWAEFLRYRANVPYNKEVQTMWDSARWIRRHYRELWS
jgi:hypothetical protein